MTLPAYTQETEPFSKKLENFFKKVSEKSPKPSGKSSPVNKDVKLNIQSSTLLIAIIFVVVVVVAVSKTDQPMHYLFSPITLVTSLVIFLAVSGILKLNMYMLILIIVLLVLTMYQDRAYRFWDDLMDDIKIIKMKTKKVKDQDERDKVVKIFHEKIAQYNNEKDFYVYGKQVDSLLHSIGVGYLDTITHNYYVIVLPDIIDVYKTPPLADTTDEKITLWTKDHKAEVGVKINGTMYTVVARAYLIKVSIDWAKYFGGALPYTTVQMKLGEIKVKPGRTHFIGINYTDFLKFLKKHEFEVDKKFDISVST